MGEIVETSILSRLEEVWVKKSRLGKFVAEGSETLPLQCFPVEPQHLRRLALVAAGQLEDAGDVAPLQGREVERLGGGGLRGGDEEGADQLGVDLAVGQRDGPLDDVLELADVAGEVV